MSGQVGNSHSSATPDLKDLIAAFWHIGILSFGGPAAQISLMHKVLVDEKRWLNEDQFLNALSFCMLLPGPEAMQLATYSGWRLRGLVGGLIGGLLFVLPGAAIILALASLYAIFGNLPLVATLFLGVKAAVLVIVIEALLKVARRALKRSDYWLIAGLAFVGIFFLALPFPLIILAAAIYGFFFTTAAARSAIADVEVKTTLAGTLATIAIWLAIWWVPLLALHWIGQVELLAEIGTFFSRLAVATFGGAYAVLAYMAQAVVVEFGWLTAGQMLDGLGLAETTPGPLILVTEFVGFLAGYAQGGFWLGVAGASVTLWVTFAPCFLWIFAGAPYIDWISAQPRLSGALSAITAAVVGVILNLSLWFALHVLFGEVKAVSYGPVQIWQPTLATLDWRVLVLTAVSAVLLLQLKWTIVNVLAVAAALGWAMVRFLG